MARVKQVVFYGIVIVAFAIFTDFMIKVGLRNTYHTISGTVNMYTPEIVMTEVRTTDINGYAKGKIKNNLGEDIEKIYIKLDLYSKRDVNLGTEYYEITNLSDGEVKEFEFKYKYSNVNRYEVTGVYEK